MSAATAAGADRFRTRLRVNAAEALHEGATVTDVLADVVSVLRGHGVPDLLDVDTAETWAQSIADELHRAHQAKG